MRAFEYVEPSSLDQAVQLLQDGPESALALAGGTDLLGELKEGTKSPSRLVGLSGVKELQGLEETADGVQIGAMATLGEIAGYEAIRSRYAVLAQATITTATPQIRNVGTLGGNLCQRPRCLYYRNPLTPCLKKGGRECFVVLGESRYSAILGGNPCFIVHPSDLAPALIALDAQVKVVGSRGDDEMPLEQLYVRPRDKMESETTLDAGDLVTRISVPPPPPGLRSVYLKARTRQAFDFALASLAAAVVLDGQRIVHARLVLGGVAPIPWHAVRAEEALVGRTIEEIEPDRVAELAVTGAVPLRFNSYKVTLASNLVKRAIGQLTS